MVYKYQQQTIDEMIKTAENMEKVTDKQKTIKIGFVRYEKYNEWNGCYETKKGDLHLAINRAYRFFVDDEIHTDFFAEHFDNIGDSYSCINESSYLHIDKDVFLNLNEWIESIYTDERQRKAFHEKLNLQLNALNKVIDKGVI